MKNFRLNNKVFVIAEAGVNHNGDIKLAKKLVNAAKKAGADAVKFQTFKADRLVSRGAAKANYQKKTTSADETQYAMLKKLELSQNDHKTLIRYCAQKDIVFISSPFDEESADLLERLGVSMFKVPSGEIINLALLDHLGRKGKPVILSTGMSTLKEVKEALGVLQKAGNKSVTVLHCVTEYPAPFEDVNLRAMGTMAKAFGVDVGYSDHTLGIEVPVAAAALGARVIEKHLTLSKDMEGPDHKASLEPEEFKSMVRSIRNVEQAMGDGVKQPAKSEMRNLSIVRKSIVAANDIIKGRLIRSDDIRIKRPGSGISPKDMKSVLGRQARTDIKKDSVIKWEQLV